MEYEYRAVPAPRQVKKVKGAAMDAAFAATLTEAINAEARAGWEYLGSETLTAEETRGFLRRRIVAVEETVLVFRRPRAALAARAGLEPAARQETAPAGGPAGAPAGAPAAAPATAEVRGEPRATGLNALRGRPDPAPGAARRPQAGEAAQEAPPTLLRPVPR